MWSLGPASVKTTAIKWTQVLTYLYIYRYEDDSRRYLICPLGRPSPYNATYNYWGLAVPYTIEKGPGCQYLLIGSVLGTIIVTTKVTHYYWVGVLVVPNA